MTRFRLPAHPTVQGPPKDASDEDLIKLARKGNKAAFTALVNRYEQTVYRFAYKLCRDREKAEEVFQDTFINVYRKLSTFTGRSRLSTWLYSIVANNCLMKQRKRRIEKLEDPLEVLDLPPTSHQEPSGAQIAHWPATPVDVLMKKEMNAQLDAAINKLPKEYRAVFILRDLEDRSTEETAEILKISIEATKSRLRRARAFLRNTLTPFMTRADSKP